MTQDLVARPVELVAVINSFNRHALLERALSSLTEALRSSPFGSAIIVFDAGSSDGSAEFLKAWGDNNPADNLAVIEAPAGRSSFSDGVNTGCAAAISRFARCRWLFLYETDNCLTNVESLQKAITLLKLEPKLAAAGFTVKQHDGKFYGYGMRFPSALSFALGQNLAARWHLHDPNSSSWQTNDGIRWRTCDVVFTSPLLVRREAWEQTGGFDDKVFPFSDSDLDWAWRCARLGWEMAVIFDDNVIHDNLAQLSAWSANRAIDFHRNRFRLLKRYRGSYVALLKPLLFLRHLIETGVLALQIRKDPSARQKFEYRKQLLWTVWNDYQTTRG
jgi:GT2 family glycosyltransferase